MFLPPAAGQGRRLFVSLVSLSFFASVASAATITGHVTDPDGRDVPAARVVIATSIGTAAERRPTPPAISSSTPWALAAMTSSWSPMVLPPTR